MKKRFGLAFLSLAAIIGLASCNGNTDKPNNDSQQEETKQYFDKEVDASNPYDYYFSNKISFADTGTSIKKNGKNTGFIADGVAKLKLKSVTDGDTAVFHLSDGEADTYTVAGKSYPYVTIRFQGIDTPESTSSIDPWGKAASNYGKKLLKEAEGIIVDATDVASSDDTSNNYVNRLDSNGTRWIALVWYCPKGGNPDDLSQYRSYQLDIIESCYSEGIYFRSKRMIYTADKTTEPILRSRYMQVTDLISGETEDRYGSMSIGEVFYEAGLRMQRCSEKLRIHGAIDEHYDYSKNPTEVSITEVLKNIEDNSEDNYMTRGTYVQIKGVITRFIGSNFYLMDEQGTPLYVYMGINGNSICDAYSTGDTIKIRGRICEYGGQYQMSGVVFKKETFQKVTGDEAIALPEVIDLDAVKAEGKLNAEYVKSVVGKLVSYTIEVKAKSSITQSKDSTYSLNDTYVVSGLNTNATYSSNKVIQVRVNGTLAPGYNVSLFGTYTGTTYKWTATGGKYKVTGIMGIYQEDDYQEKEIFPSYQILPGNRDRLVDGETINEIVKVD